MSNFNTEKGLKSWRRNWLKNLKRRGVKLKTCELCHKKFKLLYKRFIKGTNKKVMLCHSCKHNEKFEHRWERNIKIFCYRCHSPFYRPPLYQRGHLKSKKIGGKQKLCNKCWAKSLKAQFKDKDFSKVMQARRKIGQKRFKLLTKFNFQNKNIDCLLKDEKTKEAKGSKSNNA